MPRKQEETAAVEQRVKVKVIKPGWVHRGVAKSVGDEAEVTAAQAKRLRDKGLVA